MSTSIVEVIQVLVKEAYWGAQYAGRMKLPQFLIAGRKLGGEAVGKGGGDLTMFGSAATVLAHAGEGVVYDSGRVPPPRHSPSTTGGKTVEKGELQGYFGPQNRKTANSRW